jgi:hypothetical protein
VLRLRVIIGSSPKNQVQQGICHVTDFRALKTHQRFFGAQAQRFLISKRGVILELGFQFAQKSFSSKIYTAQTNLL